MRLINIRTFRLEEFFRLDAPPYAILSHTWGTEEVLFTDMADRSEARKKSAYAKFKGSCKLARNQGYKYIWIDTCCIDKSSSAELSESINSMYRWYAESAVCYVYLSDVFHTDEVLSSRWFTRG